MLRAATVLAAVALANSVVLATSVSYTGASGNWSAGANWSSNPTVPLNAGVNTYDVTINGKTVAFNIAGANTLNSLALTSSTLSLGAGDNLSLLNGISLTSSSINDAGAVFSDTGAVALNSSNLAVSAGGSISLPVLSTYNASTASGTFQVDGAASSLILPNFTTLSLNDDGFTARAQNGGTLHLNALNTISNTGNIFEGITFVAAGIGSSVSANGFSSLTMNGASITLQSQTGAYAEMSALTTLDNSGSIFGNFNAYSDGGQAKTNLPVLTAIYLNGAVDTLRATAGGDLEAPLLATVSGTGSVFEQLTLEASGAGSLVNVPLLGTSALSHVTANVGKGGTILWGAPTILVSSSVSIDTAGTLNLSALTDINSTSFTASNGAAINVPLPIAYGSDNNNGATYTANAGSSVTVPLLASVNNPGGSIFGSFNLTATGAGAKVNLPALAIVYLSGQNNTFTASYGGDIELPALSSVPNSGGAFDKLTLSATGAGSVINISSLGTSPLSRLNITVNGGTVTWANPTVLTASSVTIDTYGSIALAQLVKIDSTSFNAANGINITLPNVTAISAVSGTGATLQATGAYSTISLPNVASVTDPGDIFSGITFLANGTGSKVLLNGLQSATANAASITFQAVADGTLQANALASTNNNGSIFGSINLYADGLGSKLTMSALSTMHLFGSSNSLRASAGGDLELPSLAAVTTTGNIFEALNVQATGAQSLVNLSSLRSTSSFPATLSISNNGELDMGALASVPLLVTFTASFGASQVGTLDVYDSDLFLSSISPNNAGIYLPYQITVGAQPGSPVIRFFADGSSVSVTLKSYNVVPLYAWTGTTDSYWSSAGADANWPTGLPWSNNPDRTSPYAANFTLANPAPLTVAGNIDVSNIIFGTGGWQLNAGAGVLAYGANGPITVNTVTGTDTISAVIANGNTFGVGGGVTSLNKIGAGTLILTAPNTYTGGTTLFAGTLLANNSVGSATGTANVTLNGGTFGGSGKISATVIAGASPHTIAPGANRPGNSATTLTLGGLTTNANTTLAFNLITPGIAGSNDQLIITDSGGLNLSGGNIAIANTAAGQGSLGYYKIIQYTGTIKGTGISSLVLPATANDIAYVLSATHDAGYIDIHRGFLGDANDDGVVNAIDLGILATNYNSTTGNWSTGDYNGDGIVNAIDLGILASNYNGIVGAAADFDEALDAYPTLEGAYSGSSSVPEPASLFVLALAAFPLARRRRFRGILQSPGM